MGSEETMSGGTLCVLNCAAFSREGCITHSARVLLEVPEEVSMIGAVESAASLALVLDIDIPCIP